MSFSLLKTDHRNMKARISVWKFGFDQSNNTQKFEVAEGEYLLITLCIQWMLKHSQINICPTFSSVFIVEPEVSLCILLMMKLLFAKSAEICTN